MDLDDIIANKIIEEIAPEAKDRMISEYLTQRIASDSYRIRNKVEDMIVKECVKALDERKQDIADAVNEALTETLENKNTISKWIIKRRLIAGAKYILTQL